MRHNWPALTAQYVENLVSIYALATPGEIKAGRAWYAAAKRHSQTLAKRHGVPLDRTVGIIAALSPGSKWERNKASADEFLGTYAKCSTCTLETLRLSLHLSVYGLRPLEKAWSILSGAPIERTLSGAKTTAFYRCIMGPKQVRDVCIDGHAKTAAMGVRARSDTVGKVARNEYQYLETAFRSAAEVADLIPSAFQAVVWLTWRRQPMGYKVESILRSTAA